MEQMRAMSLCGWLAWTLGLGGAALVLAFARRDIRSTGPTAGAPLAERAAGALHLRGRVLDPDGQPTAAEIDFLPGVFVAPVWAANGVFEAEAPPGSTAAFARAYGRESWLAALPGDGSSVELRLRRGARIAGRLTTEGGAPLAGMLVSCTSGHVWARDAERRCHSDANGRFEFEDVVPGVVWLWLDVVHRRDLVLRELALDEGESVELDWIVPTPRPVRVRGLVTAGGAPFAGASVSTRAAQDGRPIAAARADAEGRYQIVLEGPGPIALLVDASASSPGGARFELDLSAANEIELDLALPLGAIAGVVRGESGAPASDVAVALTRVGEEMDVRESEASVTDAAGRFAFEHLASGKYAVTVRAEALSGMVAGRSSGIVVDAGRTGEVLLQLARPACLRIEVRTESGEPLDACQVEIADGNGALLRVFSRYWTNTLELPGLPSGAFRLRAHCADRVGDWVDVELHTDTTSTLELRLPSRRGG